MSFLHREISANSAFEECLAIAAGWPETCWKEHKYCSRMVEETRLPTRAIDVGSDGVNPKVYVTEKNTSKWAALSYCWGSLSDVTLTQENLACRQEGRPVAEFPKTLQDAIILTHALGLQSLNRCTMYHPRFIHRLALRSSQDEGGI
jgi:hypothetical protein